MAKKERRSKARLEAEGVLIDLSEKSDKELRKILDELYREEEIVSRKRRLLHGKIDILKAEIVRRLGDKRKQGKEVISGKDIERLTEILAKGLK